MDNLTLLRFTHANNNEQVYIVKNLISGFYFSPAQKCTYIVSTSNTIFPVKETVEQTRQKIGYQVEGEAANV